MSRQDDVLDGPGKNKRGGVVPYGEGEEQKEERHNQVYAVLTAQHRISPQSLKRKASCHTRSCHVVSHRKKSNYEQKRRKRLCMEDNNLKQAIGA